MLGNELARFNLACYEYDSEIRERAIKHWLIGASAGYYKAMLNLQIEFEEGNVIRDAINSTLTAYNNSCVEMRSEARDAYIRLESKNIVVLRKWKAN